MVRSAHFIVLTVIAIFTFGLMTVNAQEEVPGTISQFCPVTGLQQRPADFAGDGVILTAFDWRATWHFNVATGRRYPLQEIAPCGRGCHLSPDGLEMTYFNDLTNAHNTTRLDGANRTFLTTGAIDVQWWDDDTFFGWTPGLGAFTLRSGEEQEFDATELVSVQPGGEWGISMSFDGEDFQRALVPLTGLQRQGVPLGEDVPYFNNYAWSPSGDKLAYVEAVPVSDDAYASEIYLIDVDEQVPHRMTDLIGSYGIRRVNGVAVNELSWSPDGTNVAFWVVEPPAVPADEEDAEATSEVIPTEAIIHVLNTDTGDLTVYCGFSTTTHTPNTPRLVWSPEGNLIAFAADVQDDGHGAYLLALDVESGIYTILTEGIYGVYGIPDVYLWGRTP